MSQKKDIKIIVFKGGEKIQLFTYINEYRSLMELLSDKLYLENFGECKGMGRCCTCLIKINSKFHKVNDFEGNELATLKKHNFNNLNDRLSCQIIIDQNLELIEIEL